tara:strand:- start:3509 stop:4558 length:1050 start_codon:yes stop_codon:yes gene_type:complete
MNKKRLIYIHVGLSSFVKKDIEILSNEFQLVIFYFDLKSKLKLPLIFLKQFFFILRKVRSTDGIVTQFGGYQSFLPSVLGRAFRKKSIIIMGGTDSVSFPSIQYGCFYKQYLKYFTRKSLEYSSLLLPVSENLIECDYTYQKADYKRQGYKVHAPKVNTPAKTIYNGYNPNKWVFSSEKVANSFITIAADLGSRFGSKLKGIDLIINTAPKFPDCNFYIVGGDKLNEKLPENVIPIGNMPNDELPKFISDKQFYLQLSMSEGFPNSLCEAMLCGAIPIVSNVGAMPKIVGADGFILKEKSDIYLESIINLALKSNKDSLAVAARKRIADNFSLSRRKNELISTISKHIK